MPRSPSGSRSRSRSPQRRRRSPSRRRSRSRRRSPVRRRSPSPPPRRPARSRSRSPPRKRSRSRSPPRKRSRSKSEKSTKAPAKPTSNAAADGDDEPFEMKWEIVDGVAKLNGDKSYRAELMVPRPQGRMGMRAGTISIRGPSRLVKYLAASNEDAISVHIVCRNVYLRVETKYSTMAVAFICRQGLTVKRSMMGRARWKPPSATEQVTVLAIVERMPSFQSSLHCVTGSKAEKYASVVRDGGMTARIKNVTEVGLRSMASLIKGVPQLMSPCGPHELLTHFVPLYLVLHLPCVNAENGTPVEFSRYVASKPSPRLLSLAAAEALASTAHGRDVEAEGDNDTKPIEAEKDDETKPIEAEKDEAPTFGVSLLCIAVQFIRCTSRMLGAMVTPLLGCPRYKWRPWYGMPGLETVNSALPDVQTLRRWLNAAQDEVQARFPKWQRAEVLPQAWEVVSREEVKLRGRDAWILCLCVLMGALFCAELLHFLLNRMALKFARRYNMLPEYQPLKVRASDMENHDIGRARFTWFVVLFVCHSIFLFVLTGYALDNGLILGSFGFAFEVIAIWFVEVLVMEVMSWAVASIVATSQGLLLPHPAPKILKSIMPGIGSKADHAKDFTIAAICYAKGFCANHGRMHHTAGVCLGYLTLFFIFFAVPFLVSTAERRREVAGDFLSALATKGQAPKEEEPETQDLAEPFSQLPNRDGFELFVDENENEGLRKQVRGMAAMAHKLLTYVNCMGLFLPESFKGKFMPALTKMLMEQATELQYCHAMLQALPLAVLAIVAALIFGGSPVIIFSLVVGVVKGLGIVVLRKVVLPVLVEDYADAETLELFAWTMGVDAKPFRHGAAAAHLAANKGLVKVLEALAEEGADMNAKDKFGLRPAHWAARACQAESLRVLADSGADIGLPEPDANGLTATHRAAEYGDASSIYVLAKSGVDLNAKDATEARE
ncbi:unnamed protein product, partial [Polarella glacialis]